MNWKGASLAGLIVLGFAASGTGSGSAAKKAVFAGGCFWCMQPPFEGLDGVLKVVAGYTGGKVADPTYEDYGAKGHLEAVEVTYDPSRISYDKLLDVYWRQVDPTDPGGQFHDRGKYYSTAIFYHDEEQKRLALASKAALDKSGRFEKPIVTAVVPASTFYPAEEYHQDYYRKNVLHYKMYRAGSGRDAYIKKHWGSSPGHEPAAPKVSPTPSRSKKMSKEELRKKLTPLQYEVTQEEGTEPPFRNEYWDNHREGIYVDVVTGEPLFSSKDKYDSGTGWPSFTKPIDKTHVTEKTDHKMFSTRTEVRSKEGNCHLGHVFPDGPGPAGTRYCMNSAAMRFIPKEDLEKEGYGEYKKLF